MSQYAEAKNIYERITFEAFVKINLAADRRDSDAIAVMSDPLTTPVNKRRFAAILDDFIGPVRVGLAFEPGPTGSVIGPKRSEFRQNSGRAPIVKMSRMIPPTPVAAP